MVGFRNLVGVGIGPFSKNNKNWRLIKVSKFQNELMKSSFLPKYEPKFLRISLEDPKIEMN